MPSDQVLNLLSQVRCHLPEIRLNLAAPLRGFLVGVKGIVNTRIGISFNFTVDRSMVTVENFVNIYMRLAT